jgi:2-methylaconitate cis-trans-isomerase PrpF
MGERAIECSILRGGTSRGVFFESSALPSRRKLIEPILLNVFGSPDMRQINGLGGATSQTSKAAIIGPPSRDDADVDYTFAQVSVTSALVDWGGNCGNISSAVGPYAIDAGHVPVTGDLTRVRIHNTNTGQIIVAQVPTRDGRAVIEGDYAIPGVPGTGARILLEFTEPAGSTTGSLLPTGQPRETLTLASGRSLTASIVDAANPIVFLLAAELGLTGTELPTELEANTAVIDSLEEARGIAAEMIGVVADRLVATATSPGLPKVGFVGPPAAYTTTTGEHVESNASDLSGRLMSMQTAHRSYMATGAICTAAAAFIPGTVVHQVVRPSHERPDPDTIRIANPYGVMEAVARVDGSEEPIHVLGVAIGRTALHILDGRVWLPESLVLERPVPVEAGAA